MARFFDILVTVAAPTESAAPTQTWAWAMATKVAQRRYCYGSSDVPVGLVLPSPPAVPHLNS